MISVLIVAQYAAVRAGLHALLGEAEDLSVRAEVSGSEEMESLLPSIQPDIVLFDANPEDNSRVSDLLLGCNIGLVVLSDDAADWTHLTESGLHGWAILRKEADAQEIEGAVRAAGAGLIALDHSFTGMIAHPDVDPTQEHEREQPRDETLSAREREVLQLMTLGLPNKQIAARLKISLSTVKFHVAAILSKLNASSRTEAVTLGIRRGDVSL